MPHLSGLLALGLVREKDPDIPFILVSGTIGEELAVEAMKAGAHDYVMKDNLARLVPAVGRELSDAAGQRERRRVEEALRASEERLRTIFEAAAEGILVADIATRKFLYANPAICRMLGYEAEELLRLGVDDIHPEEDLPRVIAEFEAQARREKSVAADLPCLRKDGTKVYADICTANLVIDGRPCNAGFFTDITERKRIEEQLRQAQRMEAIGRLAGGVAHDFNNILTVIAGYCELLLADLPAGSDLRPDVEEVAKAADRAGALTRQLLTISRDQVVQAEVLDLNAVIVNMEQMLRRLIGEDVQLETALAPELEEVRVDPGQVEQVLLNLAANARDAMPRGGKLTIETASVELDDSYAQSHNGVQPGRYVLLAVSDTGTGIDGSVLPHIFEPFFTTKRQGRGTGLGLSIVYGIVRQSGGHIWVYSEPGKGTTFKIYLPVTEREETVPWPAPVSAPSEHGAGVILLVEDQEAVRAMLTKALAARGYTLLEAADGEEAVRLLAGRQGPIDLLITDVVMPVMSGRELAERLAAERPGMKVLFISGFADRAIVHHGMLSPGINYLQKPFPLSELTRKVEQILKGTSGSRGVSGE